MKVNEDGHAAPRQVSEGAAITAMDPCGDRAARWARHSGLAGGQHQGNAVIAHLEQLHDDGIGLREQSGHRCLQGQVGGKGNIGKGHY
jgi:exopolyphosphatase/pppGpp-phosphohydrolase